MMIRGCYVVGVPITNPRIGWTAGRTVTVRQGMTGFSGAASIFARLFRLRSRMIWCTLAIGGAVLLAGASAGLVILRAPKLVAINIATEPLAAEVFIDGQPVGVTPLTTAVPEGEHTLLLSKTGFLNVERRIYADRSAPRAFNDFTFGLEANLATDKSRQKPDVVAKLKLQAQEAYLRGDLVAPENDNALYYIGQLSLISPNDPMIEEMRERIRQTLKQRAEAARPRNDLA